MALRAGNFNFSKGEISEELIARVDVPAYGSALKRGRNVIALKYGGVTKRPGMRFVAPAWDEENAVRILPFQFSLDNAYVLEMGQAYMRPIALGGLVLETKYKVMAITKAANAQVTVAYHGYTVGKQVYFSGITGMTEINGRFGTVQSVIDANNFTVDIDTTGYSTFVDSDGATNVSPPPAPPPPPPPPPPTPPPSDPPDIGGSGGYDDGQYVDPEERMRIIKGLP